LKASSCIVLDCRYLIPLSINLAEYGSKKQSSSRGQVSTSHLPAFPLPLCPRSRAWRERIWLSGLTWVPENAITNFPPYARHLDRFPSLREILEKNVRVRGEASLHRGQHPSPSALPVPLHSLWIQATILPPQVESRGP